VLFTKVAVCDATTAKGFTAAGYILLLALKLLPVAIYRWVQKLLVKIFIVNQFVIEVFVKIVTLFFGCTHYFPLPLPSFKNSVLLG
jgi:hypothetical protein